jgi:hypothetical protein
MYEYLVISVRISTKSIVHPHKCDGHHSIASRLMAE